MQPIFLRFGWSACSWLLALADNTTVRLSLRDKTQKHTRKTCKIHQKNTDWHFIRADY